MTNVNKIKIAGTQYDRRTKLSEEDKAEIRRAYPVLKNKTLLAQLFGVSPKIIALVLDPEKREKTRAYQREHNRPNKETGAERAQATRDYKRQLLKNGRLK